MDTTYKYEVSFIIPVYNLEDYISECLNSIIRQSNVIKQIIIINDGSTDNTLDICRKYENKYPFIKIVDKKKEGVSVARNIGIMQSESEYICFMDGDDIYICDFICKFLEVAKKNDLDILRGRYSIVKGNSFVGIYPKCLVCPNNAISGETYLKKIISAKCSEVVPWLGLYKTEFIKKNNLMFPHGISFTEDQLFFLQSLLTTSCRIMDIDYCFYGYRIRSNSATTGLYSEEKVCNIFKITDEEIALANFYPDIKSYILKYASTTLSQVFAFYKRANKEQKKNIIKKIKEKKYGKLILFSYSITIKVKIFLAIFFPFILRIVY